MKVHNFYQQLPQYFVLLLLVSSCTIYAPMQPTISTVRQQGQMEVAASIQASGRVEGSVVYSPLPHVLVMGAGTLRPKLGDSAFSATRQWEAGVGSYLPLGKKWLLTGIGGYGYANSHKAYTTLPIIYSGSYEEYQARYSKLFGQLSLSYEAANSSFGAVYRLSKLSYDQVNYMSTGSEPTLALPVQSATRGEALLFYRWTLDDQKRWQMQLTTGLSVDSEYQEPHGIGEGLTGNERWRLETANTVRKPVLMTSLGVVFRPQLRRQK